jgi:thymidine kinase
MFARKSDRLLDDLAHRKQFGRQQFQLFHPQVNWRDGNMCRSRTGKEAPSREFKDTEDLRNLIDLNHHVIAIDEVQFCDPNIVPLILELRDSGHDVICSGLDFDFYGVPFRIVSTIVNLATFRHQLSAWCTECGKRAQWSQLLEEPPQNGNVVVGNNYAARCEHCFIPKSR